MNCTTYFHTNYTSSNVEYYTKVSIDVGSIGLFCVVRNKNGSLQRQRYIYSQKSYNCRWYRGNSQNGFYKDLQNLDWSNLSDEEKNNLHECVKHLKHAKAYFIPAVAKLSQEDFDYLNDYVNGLIMDFEYLYQNGTLPTQSAIPTATTTATAETQSTSATEEDTQSSETPVEIPAETPVETPTETDEWTDIDLSILTHDDLRNIIEMIQANDNPDGGIAYNGKTYTIINENGNMILKVKDAVSITTETPTEKPTEKPIVRKTVQMAQMLDNKNLTEFVNGCFYRIVNNNTANQFIGISNDKGETRMVKRNRVSIINVFAEPPNASNPAETRPEAKIPPTEHVPTPLTQNRVPMRLQAVFDDINFCVSKQWKNQ